MFRTVPNPQHALKTFLLILKQVNKGLKKVFIIFSLIMLAKQNTKYNNIIMFMISAITRYNNSRH